MANGWTQERRAQQSALIQTWRPWEHSTGPRTADGKARTARNAFKGGQWLELQELSKVINAALREQRDAIGDLRRELLAPVLNERTRGLD